ncbi:12826_t:CDS:1, partial [Funneliformis geosporum]
NKPSVGNTLNDSIHANKSWADETEAELSCRHDNKYQPSLDSISTQLVNISQQLADIQNQLGFTLTR